MNREPVAWVFNLDAEDELKRGGPHTPTQDSRARTESLLPVLRKLLGPGDEILWPGDARSLTARVGRAWCPTRWACDQIRNAGLRVPEAPSPDVLRRVNHRKFAHELGQALPGARFVETEAQLREALSDLKLLERVSCERNWLMKLPLGYAGRGRRKISSAAFNAADRTWIEAALRSGDGLLVEPLVERTLDVGLHGWLAADGAIALGTPTVSTIDASGTWVATELAPAATLSPNEDALLRRTSGDTGTALHRAGYVGPFGLDAFRWRAPDGEIFFQPRCELNARYSMGWAVGMGAFRP